MPRPAVVKSATSRHSSRIVQSGSAGAHCILDGLLDRGGIATAACRRGLVSVALVVAVVWSVPKTRVQEFLSDLALILAAMLSYSWTAE
jgi:hypothetical protein